MSATDLPPRPVAAMTQRLEELDRRLAERCRRGEESAARLARANETAKATAKMKRPAWCDCAGPCEHGKEGATT